MTRPAASMTGFGRVWTRSWAMSFASREAP